MRTALKKIGWAAVFGAPVLLAQAPAPAFEVATVKVTPASPPNGGLIAMDRDPAMLHYSNITLKTLIAIAYRFDDRLILGGPGWLDSEHYELSAKIPPGTEKDRVPLMLQTLLAERFKLAVHRETKDQRVYFLLGGKKGPKLKDARQSELREPGAPDTEQVRGDRVPMQILPGRITGHGVPIASLAAALARVAGYSVLDRTQLGGMFDLDLKWTPENSKGTGPDLFTAIQEQLGLKLEAGRAPIESLLVDHVKRVPAEN
jgi:uncharacterized protein (TIGR03435 family)